ncbi:hypothetical protein [Stutzerimonas stutzeri]|jgi:hypothetical protein|uniref:Uncharacterized protein n=1 Tax=Stutzerimonas stutzeri TaxID=316 RepID=A0A5S5B6Q8_STUST|nr:hypothetical protein [Stutzerimonas stutzeri]TYP62026.1 hypothetical protein A9A72_124777 [Stutzerimonas stutzeri]
MEVTSEAEYHALTKQLAMDLLKNHTPEQLAVTAAQHMMLSDALGDSNDALRKSNAALQELNSALQALSKETAAQLKLEAETADFLAKNSARIAKLVLDSSKHIATQQKKANYEQTLGKFQRAKDPAIKRAQEIASEHWDAERASGRRITRVTRMAAKVFNQLKKEGYYEVLPSTEQGLKKWINPVTPDEARRRGPDSIQDRREVND